ncbi:MAG: AarF/ABC1/UbiB kinase family protein [Acidimicrobiia bacterium]
MRTLRRVLIAIAATLGLAGAVTGLVVAVREVRRSGSRVLVERVRRARRIAYLGARRWVAHLRLQHGEPTPEQLDEFHLHTAEQVFELLGGMKGVVMKLGQLASVIGDALPDAYAESLRGLQQQAPPMAGHLVADVVQRELGGPPERVFYEFSHEPVAAASIGQVHKAELFDGTPVAVKLQYPGIDVAIRADLDNAFLLYNAVRMMAPGIEPGPMVDELRARMLEEIDYRLEAANQAEFAAAYAGHPWIRIPAVYPDLSTSRLLVTEWVTGRSFYDVLDESQEARDRIGEQLYRFWAGSVVRLRLFNGDPHPGNYFMGDGVICFLDFGLVKRFDEGDVRGLREQIVALRSGDPDAVHETMIDHGWAKPDAPIDPRRAKALAELINLAILHDEPFTFTREHVREVVEATMGIMGPYGDVVRNVTFPPNQMILNRMQIGLMALLARLGATANWAAIMDEYLFDAPPSTELGREAAAWPIAAASSGGAGTG